MVTFVKHFQANLLGRYLILRTDHGSLQWLYNFREPEGQMVRWLELLQEFDFEVIHWSGRCHTNADALSRYKDEGKGNSPCVTATLLAAKDSRFSMNIQQLQQEDDVIGPIHQALSQGAQPNLVDIKGNPESSLSWFNNGTSWFYGTTWCTDDMKTLSDITIYKSLHQKGADPIYCSSYIMEHLAGIWEKQKH